MREEIRRPATAREERPPDVTAEVAAEPAPESEPVPEPTEFHCRFCKAVLQSRADLRSHEENFHPAKGRARELREQRIQERKR